MKQLLQRQTQLLLRSDLTAANPEWRRQVCEHLLDPYAQGTLHLFDWDVEIYQVLAHPDLGAQLAPFITSASSNQTVRRVAILIAHGCRERAATDALLKLALDAAEDPSLRESAVRALVEFGDRSVLTRLRPLAGLPAEHDPYEQIKGMVLSALSLRQAGAIT